MPNRDVLNFITSGRMSGLRELSIAIDYKDWVSSYDPFQFMTSRALPEPWRLSV
jgi:hypothetical protein